MFLLEWHSFPMWCDVSKETILLQVSCRFRHNVISICCKHVDTIYKNIAGPLTYLFKLISYSKAWNQYLSILNQSQFNTCFITSQQSPPPLMQACAVEIPHWTLVKYYLLLHTPLDVIECAEKGVKERERQPLRSISLAGVSTVSGGFPAKLLPSPRPNYIHFTTRCSRIF